MTTEEGVRDEGRIVTYEREGLNLAMRVFGPTKTQKAPIVCLPGLTRNSRDFTAFANAIRDLDPERTVIAFDYRGRGLSDAALEAEAYNAAEEAKDVLAGLDHLGVRTVDLVGTSRGVIVTHLIAAMAADRIARVVFNDAGPRIEVDGLLGIREYLGAAKAHESLDKAANAIEALFGPTFPALDRADFERQTRALLVEREGVWVPDFDPKLLKTLDTLEPGKPLPELWQLFDLLKEKPLLVLRGEHSDILSVETADEMAARHPDCRVHVVEGQGHAPFLETAGLPRLILDFLAT
ncbi:alpha/beta hydrolase [Fulvimarina sp. MAC8]|uniref:alpha/beta fold hydrolase n=1 Tax=Fulvimarina sp. MAC8 TaxID=3162874 RepID=UPI0032EE8A59